MLLCVTKARLASLAKAGITNVTVTVRQPPFGEDYIHSVIWPGENRVELAERSGGQIAFGLYFLFLGIMTMIYLPEGASALVQHIALYTSALVVATGGYAFARLSPALAHSNGDISEAQSRFLGIPLGRGKGGLFAMTLVCLALNAALFWSPSILLLLGLNTAFALGGCVAYLQRALQR
jgi:hypothetical protein